MPLTVAQMWSIRFLFAAFLLRLMNYSLTRSPPTMETFLSMQQTFPAVTICNMNPYKKKRAGEVVTAFDAELNTFMDYSHTILSQSLYSFDELITSCAFEDIYFSEISEESFTQFIDPSYGRCFTFKGTTPGFVAGEHSRLTLIANVQKWDNNSTESRHYPFFGAPGVKVVVHDPSEYPDFEKGQNARAGYNTEIGLEAEYKYSEHSCYATCSQKEAFERCNCHNSRYFGPSTGASFCSPTPTNVSCLGGLKSHSEDETTLEERRGCNCKPACKEVEYKMNAQSIRRINCYEGFSLATNTKCFNQLEVQVFFDTTMKTTHSELFGVNSEFGPTISKAF